MNLPRIEPPNSTEAELKAFEATCKRLAGFSDEINFESIDGFLTALAAGPWLPQVEDWLPALFGDVFERAFADPQDHDQALRSLQARLQVLRRQLDPELLLEEPEYLRLLPLMFEYTDADRETLVKQHGVSAEEAALAQTGALWAQGFLTALKAFPNIWSVPAEVESAVVFRAFLDQIAALTLLPGSKGARRHMAHYWPGKSPSREDLLTRACWAAEDLRVFWIDHAPRPATRHVAPTPGRNEPCPCGSGKKYKKCHGAAAD